MNVVELNSVWKIYPHKSSDVVALKNIHLNIRKGEFMALMGPSGSGKSTLMHLIGCLDRPTRGDLKIQGESVQNANDAQLSHLRSKSIGFVFQSFHLIPQLTVLENVNLPFYYNQKSPKGEAVLDQVGLNHRMDHYPSELSGGERQRVAIARALAGDPLIILADEPTGNLDTETGDTILNLLEDLHKAGKTILMVTHDPHVAQRSQKIIHMKDGEL
ncbi:MAG: putative ABC transporter ATP-binding protein YknY [Chlamydiae bacterium]|nr:putative ABC transporter ATP-binding protein YknY [Chlamydiota bacterium]